MVNVANFEARDGELYVDNRRVIRGWESFSGWYFFATEDRGESEFLINGRGVVGREYYGLVQGFEEEWGSWTMAELDPLIKRGKVWEIEKHDLPHAGRRL